MVQGVGNKHVGGEVYHRNVKVFHRNCRHISAHMSWLYRLGMPPITRNSLAAWRLEPQRLSIYWPWHTLFELGQSKITYVYKPFTHHVPSLYPQNWMFQYKNRQLIGFFPTCQVRVVRFYQSCSLPPRLALLFLFSSASSSASSPSSSTSTSTVALPTLRQAPRQRPSSVCTARPQPGTFPAQCAPLDLNLGPAQLSVHGWTSTAR